MRIVRGVAKLVAIVLVVVIVAVVGLIGIVTARGVPQTMGTVRLAGLHGSATVIRDRAGILQIYADDPHDLFFAQGFAHAQERMWQMEVDRHIALGRVSELFGKGSIDTDRFIRTLDWAGTAQRDLDALPQDTRAALDAYAAGVNAWIDGHAGALSLPFVVTGLRAGTGGLGGYTPEHWTPLDSIAWQKVQAWSLGSNMGAEIFRMLADTKVGDPKRVDELFPAYDPAMPVITPTRLLSTTAAGAATDGAAPAISTSRTAASRGTAASRSVSPSTSADWSALAEIGASIRHLAGFDEGSGMAGDRGIGSNEWVVSAKRSATGGALLANDPHLGYSMPSVWIINGVHCRTVTASCPWDAEGVTFPGGPAVILGHNARIAWGATNVGPDVEDLFRETVDPNDPTHYLSRGTSLPFTVRHETIKVAGGPDVSIDVRSTVHGPILNDVEKSLTAAPLLALRWTTLAEVDGSLDALFHVGLATDFASFRAAFRGYNAPAQNFAYADVDGHIAYVFPGLIPIRAGAKTGDRIRDGASGTDDWTGYIPFDELPWQLDPPSGLIVTANNAAVDADYPYYVASDWDPGWRAKRILDRLEAIPAGHVSTADLRAIQLDTHPLRTDTIIPLLEPIAAPPSTEDGRLLLDRIRSWDRTCGVDSVGCAAYATAELMLTRAIVDDQLGDLARDWVGQPPSWQFLIAMLKDPTNAWWDDVRTAAKESARDIVPAAIDAAAKALRDAYGDPSRWTWGRMHAVTFSEQTLGTSGIGPLSWYFDQGPRPLAGVDGAVDNMYYRPGSMYPDPYDPSFAPVGIDHVFDVTNGPSYRLTIDMSRLDDARIVITTGQSGNPFDRHYGDMIATWANGETVAFPFSRAAIEEGAAATLTLTP